MSPTVPPTMDIQPTSSKPPPKLPRIPSTHRISKRPLLHPAIATPYAGASTPKIVYVSANTPFISAVKRVRKYLGYIEERGSNSGGKKIELAKFDNSMKGDGGDGRLRKELERVAARRGKGEGGEEVLIKGTGKAIQRVLQLAVYFQAQSDVLVKIRTGSVGAVDDVVSREETAEDAVVEEKGEGEGDEDVDVPESQVRRTSCLEVGISLR